MAEGLSVVGPTQAKVDEVERVTVEPMIVYSFFLSLPSYNSRKPVESTLQACLFCMAFNSRRQRAPIIPLSTFTLVTNPVKLVNSFVSICAMFP